MSAVILLLQITDYYMLETNLLRFLLVFDLNLFSHCDGKLIY